MQIKQYLDDLPSNLTFSGNIAIDTEAMGLSTTRDRLCLLQISCGDGVAHLVQFRGNYNAVNIKKLLQNDEITKIFHFARFDLAILQHYLNIDIKNVYCTKTASRLIRTYSKYHGLKELCRELLNVKISKENQSSNWGQEKLSVSQLEYASNDVLYLHRLKEELDKLLIREGRMDLALGCFSFLPVRAKLDVLGWGEELFVHH